MMRRLLVLEIAAHYLPLLMMVDTRSNNQLNLLSICDGFSSAPL